MNATYFLFGQTGAYQRGVDTGYALASILFLLGLIGGLCLFVYAVFFVARRPQANRKCVGSVIIFLIGIFVLFMGGVFYVGFGGSQFPIAFGVHCIGIAFVIGASILALRGLSEYRKYPGVYKHGRGLAVFTLIVASVILVIDGTIFIWGFSKGLASILEKNQSSPKKALIFTNLNFQFLPPAEAWVEYHDPDWWSNPDVKIAFMRQFPEVRFLLLAAPVGSNHWHEVSQLVSQMQIRQSQQVRSASIVATYETNYNHLHGIQTETEVQDSGLGSFYVQWHCLTNQVGYVCICWGIAPERSRVMSEATKMFLRLELMTPKGNLPGP